MSWRIHFKGLLARSPSDFLKTLPEAKWQESHFICFDFQKTFHSRDVFCRLCRPFVWLGFRLLCASLVVHYLAVYLVLKYR